MNLLKRLTGQEKLGKSGQDIIWNVVSYGIMAVCGVALNFIIANSYGSAVLGVYNQVYAVYIVVSQFSAVGIHLSVLKYVSEFAHDEHKHRVVAASGLITSVVFGLLTCVVLWFIRGWIGDLMKSPDVAASIVWILPGLFFFTLNKVYLSVLNGLSRMKAYAVFQAMRYILLILLLVGMIVTKQDTHKITAIFSLAEFILFLALTAANFRDLVLPGRSDLVEWSRKHFSFGMRGFLSNVLLGLNPRIDVLLLGYFCSDQVVGVFSLAAAAAEGIYQLVIVLRTNINPRLVQLLSTNKKEELETLSRKSVKFTYLAMIVIGAMAVLVYPVGLMFVSNKAEFLQSWPYFAILVAGMVASSGYIPFSNILLLAGQPGLQTVMISIQVFANFLGNALLIPLWGGAGAAIATALAYAFLVILVKQFSRRVLKLNI
jgi:O-antigen/teichoic acid export membrane protein